jgi:type II secretory pathway component GspD/PulD (secretin)
MRQEPRSRLRRFSVFVFALMSLVAPSVAEDAPGLTIALPPQTELDKLIDLTARFVGVSIQYNPQKINGVVRLAVRGELSKSDLWAVFNQVLVSQGFTTVIAGLPPVYQVVPMAEAAGLSVPLSPKDAAELPFEPGYQVLVLELAHVRAEAVVKVLSTTMTGQVGQIRTLGQEGHKVVASGPRSVISQIQRLLGIIDRPGVEPAVRLYRPLRAGSQSLQTSTTSAWSALGRISGSERLMELQMSPDGSHIVIISSAEHVDQVVDLLAQLDNAEPVETRNYRPKHFGVDEVATLLQQMIRSEKGTQQVEVVRDKLTNSLVIKATAEQHRRIEGVLKNLDDAPPTARRQVRSFSVRHRQADELAKVLASLISTGAVQADGASADQPAAEPAPAAPVTQQPLSAIPAPVAPLGTGGQATGGMAAAATPRQEAAPVVVTAGGDSPVVLASDVVTNSLIAIGDPKALDQVSALLKHLDQRQPQVEIEIIMVSVSSSQNRSLGFELAVLIENGSTSATVSQLFGLSQPVAGDPIARAPLAAATGLGGIILNPGDFAGVVKALETITDGRQLIRAKIVVANNAKAMVNGVVQEPLVATNASSTVATTSVSGTTDAGTEIAITPQISTADYVTLTYGISQSSFLGKSVISNGSVIPPTKRSDSVSSVATIPDGYVIALGGLSNRGEDHNESRVPFLGGIPFFGELFKSKSTGTSDSRFFVFIRATVLRNNLFMDLRRSSEQTAKEADIPIDVPRLEPLLIR